MRLALLLVFLAGCLGCGAAPSPVARNCIERYAVCSSFQPTMADYLTCRAAVDNDCLPPKGATP